MVSVHSRSNLVLVGIIRGITKEILKYLESICFSYTHPRSLLTCGTNLLANVGESEVTKRKLVSNFYKKNQNKNVRLDDADVVLAKLLLGILGGDGRRNNNIVTREPVDRGGDTLLVGGLESLDNTENLGGVTAGGGRVGQGETDLLAGVDDEDGTDGEGEAWWTLEWFIQIPRDGCTLLVNVGDVLVVKHVVEVGNLAVVVGNDGEGEVGVVDLVDVLDPVVVRVDGVGTQSDELDAKGSKLRLELGESTELGGADGGEVILQKSDILL
jgi:hypothetical protein